MRACLVAFMLTVIFSSALGPSLARAAEMLGEPVTVYAAASTQPVIDALVPIARQHNITLSPVYAGSSTLTRQIERGAPNVDVFISANLQWMDHLEQRGFILSGSRTTIATNRLVLIAPAQDTPPSPLDLSDANRLLSVLVGSRLAIADPDHVPAGIYARQALQHSGTWDALKDKLAPTKDVTGALMLVARGEAQLGIVYQSDVRRVKGVQVLGIYPTASHAPIVYQAALLKDRMGDGPRALLKILLSPQGQDAFRAAGFGVAP